MQHGSAAEGWEGVTKQLLKQSSSAVGGQGDEGQMLLYYFVAVGGEWDAILLHVGGKVGKEPV